MKRERLLYKAAVAAEKLVIADDLDLNPLRAVLRAQHLCLIVQRFQNARLRIGQQQRHMMELPQQRLFDAREQFVHTDAVPGAHGDVLLADGENGNIL